MPERQQQFLAILLLAGLAGAVLFMSARQPPPPPPSGDGNGTGPSGLTPEQIAAMRTVATPARAVPFYQNEERWELKRDARGHLKEIVVHRDARVGAA